MASKSTASEQTDIKLPRACPAAYVHKGEKTKMKGIKKFAALALALCISATAAILSSCGDGEKNAVEEFFEQVTAYSLTSRAVEKTRGLDSFDSVLDVKIKTNIAGADVTVPITSKVMAAGLKSKTPTYYTATDSAVLGSMIRSESYYEGDWCYTVNAGVGTKKPVEGGGEVSEAVETINSIQQVLPAMLLVDVTITDGDDGARTVSVPIPDDKFEEIFNEFVSEMTVQTVNGSLDGAAEITSYRSYNATVRVAVSRDGYVKSYAINFDLDVTANVTVLFFKTSTTLTANIDAELTYNEPGKAVTITFPDGYKDFPETK